MMSQKCYLSIIFFFFSFFFFFFNLFLLFKIERPESKNVKGNRERGREERSRVAR